MITNLIKKIFNQIGYIVFKKENAATVMRQMFYSADILRDIEFTSIHKKSRGYTMVNKERSFALYEATKYISRNKIEGDVVECGVWKGGQTMIMAHTLLQENDINRKIWLYDTYEGMSEPTEDDMRISTNEKAKSLLLKKDKTTERDNIWCYAPIEEVKKNVMSTGYNPNNLVFVKGKVEDTIPNQIPEKIALLRLDTDWYESTRHELVHLFPRLVKGGVLVIDDYGTWAGSKKAVDEYIKENNIKILLTRITAGCIGVRVE